MKIVLQRSSPLGIKDQIKRQIRVMVQTGRLSQGEILPSARDMATALNVNRNTVSAAYRELNAEAVLRTVVGSGTFVREDTVRAKTDTLQHIVDEALGKAVALGYTQDQITDFLFHRVTSYFGSTEGARVLVVECNSEAGADIAATLERDLSVKTTQVLIQRLEENPGLAVELLAGADLVVCGFNHVEEFRRIVPRSPVEIVAVMLKTDMRILNELMQLPPGTKVGFICANQRSTETFYRESMFSSGSSVVKIWAGLDNGIGLQSLLDQCDVMFATSYVYDRVLSIADSSKRLLKVDLSIDPANIDLIRERLALACSRK